MPATDVPAGADVTAYGIRRLVSVLAVLVLALALVLTSNAISAEAGGDLPPTAGHAVIQPGQTLWDVAVANTPAGTDVRAYLADIEQLNGIRAHDVDAWDVVLLPPTR